MPTDQLKYTEQELLSNHHYVEQLVVGGVRCHGGFDGEGNYLSPRTKVRTPAIRAWEAQRAEQFSTPLLDAPLDRWPEHYPNVAQAAFLVRSGVPEPIISTLTRIGTVEGFGSMIRNAPVPDLQSTFEDDVRGTALAHLDRGLYEAHARDEAGHADEAGHKQMWFAARDVAFESPVTEDESALMMQRMGIGGGVGGQAAIERLMPSDVPIELEQLVRRMAGLLLIEISAFHTFAWAEELLADTGLVAGDGAACRLVSYIRADETPHVEYLKTTLSEMRDRTVIGESGRRYPGEHLIGMIWDGALADSLGERREASLRTTLSEITRALDGHPRRAALLEEFHALGSISPGPDGHWAAVVGTEPTT